MNVLNMMINKLRLTVLRFMQAACVGLVLLLLPQLASAYDVVMVTPPDVDAYTTIDEPQYERAYYGILSGFPQTYRIVLASSTEITFQIAEPDIEQPVGPVSVIVVREVERGVEEVARLDANAIGEVTEQVRSTGDSYRLGERFTQTLEPGAYLIEVSNGDNLGKYVIRFGTEPLPERLGYLGTLKQIYAIKQFFGKPGIMVLQSPYYYVPTILLIVLTLMWYRRRSKRAYA